MPHPPTTSYLYSEFVVNQEEAHRGRGASPAPHLFLVLAQQAAQVFTGARDSSHEPSPAPRPPRTGAAAGAAHLLCTRCFLATHAAAATPLRVALLFFYVYSLHAAEHEQDLELELTRKLYQMIGV